MIPLPNETPGQWWDNTGSEQARIEAAEAAGYTADFDPAIYFLHDVPADAITVGESHVRDEADIVFGQPCDIKQWPDVPTQVVASAGTGSSRWNSNAE